MKTLLSSGDRRSAFAFTLTDLLVVLGVIVMLGALTCVSARPAKSKAQRIKCINNLKNMGLAFRIFATDHGDQFPHQSESMQVLSSNPPLFWPKLFNSLSNELSTTKILICPADIRREAVDFSSITVSNVSYFVGLDANEKNPQLPLAGDRNLTNGLPLKNGVLLFDPNRPVGWTHELHRSQGNVVLGDGSVQQLNSALLRATIGGVTNRLLLPE